MYVGRQVGAGKIVSRRGSEEVTSGDLAEFGKVRCLWQFYRSGILVGYETHTQKERERVRGFPGVAIETPRGLAAGTPT